MSCPETVTLKPTMSPLELMPKANVSGPGGASMEVNCQLRRRNPCSVPALSW